ncbi:hypothetical protein RUND412_006219 [Rhizina undulata]
MAAISGAGKTTAVILVADGSEEIEFVTAYDVLVRAGFHVQSVAVGVVGKQYALCSRGVKILPDIHTLTSAVAIPDVLILPGGAPGAKTFAGSPAVLQFIQHTRNEEKWVGCICAATTALVEAGTSDKTPWKHRVTSHPSVKQEIVEKGWDYSEERVVVDGRIVTSRGDGTFGS